MASVLSPLILALAVYVLMLRVDPQFAYRLGAIVGVLVVVLDVRPELKGRKSPAVLMGSCVVYVCVLALAMECVLMLTALGGGVQDLVSFVLFSALVIPKQALPQLVKRF